MTTERQRKEMELCKSPHLAQREERNRRVAETARRNPELTAREIGVRFGLSKEAVRVVLRKVGLWQ